MKDEKQISEAVSIYYKTLTVWRYTVYQELETFQIQVSQQAEPNELKETVSRLNNALYYTNQILDQMGELSVLLAEMLDKYWAVKMRQKHRFLLEPPIDKNEFRFQPSNIQ